MALGNDQSGIDALNQGEQALTGEKEFSRCLLESMADGVVACDADGILTLFNRSAREWHGLDPLRLPPDEWGQHYDLFRPDGITPLPADEIPLARAFRGEIVRDAGMAIKAKGQPIRFILANGSVILGEAGQKLGAVVIMRDVTEFRNLELKLRKAKEDLEKRVEERAERMEDALFFVAQRGWQAGGENFFDALAQYLGEKLDMDYVVIDRIDENPEIAETVALYAKGAIVPNMRYAIKGTPCENVMGRRLCFYPQDVRQLFPEDSLLAEMGVESYIGIPLWDSSERPVGLIALMNSKPLPDAALATQLLQLVATRAAAELARERSDRILRTREHEFHTLANSLPDNIVRYDREGRTVYVNPVLEKTLGSVAADMIGKQVREINPDGSYEAYAQALDATLASGENCEIELILPIPGKEPIVHQIRMIAEHDDHGEMTGVLAIGHDITERKRAVEEISKLAAIVASSDDAIIAKDLDGIILSWNRGAERIYGYSAGEAIGRSISMLVPPGHQDELVKIMTHLRQGEQIEHYTTERIRKDGQLIYISLSVFPLRDGAGNIAGASSIARDVSAQKEAKEVLRRSEERLRQAQRIARIGSWELDLVANTLIWSDEIYRIFEIDPALFAASYEAFLELIHPDDRATVNSAYTNSLKNRTPYSIEHRLLFPDGRVKHVQEQCETHYAADGNPLRSIGTIQDITELKQAEEAIRELNAGLEKRVSERTIELKKSQQALMNIVEDLHEKTDALEQANSRLQELDRLKSMFIASMSHELRTPLNSIIGFSSILHDQWLGPVNMEQKENLAIILRSGKHLLSLINDVIDVSKIEAGKVEVVVQEFDLFDMVQEGVAFIAKDIKEKGLELRVENSHLQMFTDRQRLLQCLLNLLSNAMKFTDQGSISIYTQMLQVHVTTPEENVVDISVTDTGIGIREEDLTKMFRPFVRLASPLQSTVPGTGLGLYLTRKLAVEVLKGDILLTSEYGKGSRFTIRIPVRLS